MFKKMSCSVLTGALLLLSISLYSDPLVPQTPVPITTSGDIFTSVVISGGPSNYMISCEDNSAYLVSGFSTDASSWTSSPSYLIGNTSAAIWISEGMGGFMATFIEEGVGYLTDPPCSIFTTDRGQTWDTLSMITSSTSVKEPIVVCSSANGFMSSWIDSVDNNAYAAFSSDRGASWSSFQLTNSGTVNISSAVMGASSGTGFMATWQDTSQNGWSTFSTDNGSTWSSPSSVNASIPVLSDVWVAGNSEGFLTAWVSTSGAYCSFSSDGGSSWTMPVQVTSSEVIGACDISISGSSNGFVTAWIGSDSNAYTSSSLDNGATWSEPISLTTDGSVSSGANYLTSGFVGVSASSEGAVFTWLDSSHNAQSCIFGVTPAVSSDLYDIERVASLYDEQLSETVAKLESLSL